MARVSYESALKCKRCGHFTLEINRFVRRILCQECGAHIADREDGKVAYIANNAEFVDVKITHKFFQSVIEEVP